MTMEAVEDGFLKRHRWYVVVPYVERRTNGRFDELTAYGLKRQQPVFPEFGTYFVTYREDSVYFNVWLHPKESREMIVVQESI